MYYMCVCVYVYLMVHVVKSLASVHSSTLQAHYLYASQWCFFDMGKESSEVTTNHIPNMAYYHVHNLNCGIV